MNGFDAYEEAWDVMAKHLWNLLPFNLVWLAGAACVVLLVFLFTVVFFESWLFFFIIASVVLLILSPLWEAANIVRYGKPFPWQTATVPVAKVIFARTFFLLFVSPAYLLFILPGIYLHCRLSLYLPLLIFTPGLSPIKSLAKSWAITESRFIDLYSLWIAVVVSKPVCLLPFGLGFLLERPASGLAKALMYRCCSNWPRDGPP